MIASGLAVEGGHGLGHSLHFAAHTHMAFGTPPVPEFLRPLPKPAPLPHLQLSQRYNGAAAASARSKFDAAGPVNLAQQSATPSHKDIADDDFPMFGSRFFAPPPPPHLSHYPSLPGPYGSLYPGHYTPLLSRDRPGLPPPPTSTPLSPLEAFPSPHSAPDSPASTFSPPGPLVKVSTPSSSIQMPTPSKERKFKVPSGKEGSLKHRILTTTPSSTATKQLKRKQGSSGAEVPASFSRGSLIQLASGELRRVEDMRTEDFVSSAERSPALRLDPSTVVRIEPATGAKDTNLITLSYGEHRTQVEIESAAEHPYFVFNRGWASCDPDKTLVAYGLKCHRLQVGDVCISLSPRPQPTQLSHTHPSAAQPLPADASSATASCKKRRWSAPDQYDALNGSVPPATCQPGRKAKD